MLVGLGRLIIEEALLSRSLSLALSLSLSLSLACLLAQRVRYEKNPHPPPLSRCVKLVVDARHHRVPCTLSLLKAIYVALSLSLSLSFSLSLSLALYLSIDLSLSTYVKLSIDLPICMCMYASQQRLAGHGANTSSVPHFHHKINLVSIYYIYIYYMYVSK